MTQTSRSMSLAMISAAVVAAQLAAGKATRDALFFTSLTVTALPAVVTATALFSIGLVFLYARAGRRLAPGALVPILYLVSGGLFVVEWILRSRGPAAAAVLLYLHISGIGPLLASGFWLITTERFNPRTAKKGFGRITAAGTLGALIGALIVERLATAGGGPVMILVLAAFQFAAAWLVRRVALSGNPAIASAEVEPWPGSAEDRAAVLDDGRPTMRGGLRLIAETPALRNLAALVLLGTTSAAIVDYVFKARAVGSLGPGDRLLGFFALYYAGTSAASLLLQTLSSRAVLQRFGLAVTTSTPSLALVAGSLASLFDPAFASLLVARGGEAVFRASWFRAGYELFYTPMPMAERRAAKSLIDVAFDRLGDAVGAAIVRIVILTAPAVQTAVMLGIASATSIAAIAVASRLHRWYLRTLETSLVSRGSELAPGDTIDPATARVLNSLRGRPTAAPTTVMSGVAMLPDDDLIADIVRLRSGNHDSAMRVLTRPDGIAGPLVPHVIPLLASPSLADYALFALRKVAEERIGELTDALLNPGQDDTIRRRLARVFSVGVSQRAADGLLAALDDARFDVRFQTARSLAAIVDRNPLVRIAPQRIFAVVLDEVTVSQPVWESRRLLDGFVSASPLDVFVRDRAGQSLAHVFTLLSLVLPRQPLLIAFRSLHSDDAYLRGTALEYLDGVLPHDIRQKLWPFLVRSRARRSATPRTQAIANLLRSSRSVTVRGAADRGDANPVAGFPTH
jgi:AAA family ATP:ADP antiporter